jgi:hypothetical protein
LVLFLFWHFCTFVHGYAAIAMYELTFLPQHLLFLIYLILTLNIQVTKFLEVSTLENMPTRRSQQLLDPDYASLRSLLGKHK